MILQQISNSRAAKGVSLLLITQIVLSGMNWGTAAYAGDGGPTQPEVHSFEPVGTDQMVDLFTGDFTYNIPLFNLPGPDGGYPINLAYHSGVQMEQEASWVGLGWNINMGTINRQVRNLPDDFGGTQEENITIKTDARPSWTVGAGYKRTKELFGFPSPYDNVAVMPSVTRNFALYYNNYRGIGYSVDIGFSVRIHPINASGDISEHSGDLGYNVKLDSQEGITTSVITGVSLQGTNASAKLSASTNVNNRNDWQRSINIGGQITKSAATGKKGGFNTSGGTTISFAHVPTSLSTPNAMKGGSGSFSLGKGTNAVGVFKKNSVNIFFNSSKLKYKNDDVHYKGIGYMYYQTSPDSGFAPDNDHRIKDASRENDGLVHKNTRRLAIPTLSYDIYSVTGQGIGNMFRPVRTDIGTMVTPRVKSEYHGGNLGIEKNTLGNTRIGIDLSYQYSNNETDLWPNANAAGYGFSNGDASVTRAVYFKNYGERSADDLVDNYGATIATNKPVAYGLKNEDNFYDITNIDQETQTNIQIETQRNSRRKRAVGIEAFTNAMMMDGGTTLMSEFKLKYYNSTSSGGYNRSGRTDYDTQRDDLTGTHVGGYIATNEGGMRYVYGLPAQNHKERDVTFSVSEQGMANAGIATDYHPGGSIDYKQPGTDKYYNSVEKGRYAHSYMLTSILGQDYVDLDNVAGPSDGDLGYWVRFDYFKAHNNYKWRSPYAGALYDKGYATSFSDGKGRYSYGEKEIWYVATVETKTHVAEFIVSQRDDCKQVADEIAGGTGSGAYYKLDKINVYVKNERYPNGVFNASAKPLQTCHFDYDYSLCKGNVDNNGTAGKLTLKKIWFTYRNNQTGASTPYEFEYNTHIGPDEIWYSQHSVDRWGNYQPGGVANIDYPYNDPYTEKATMDKRAALWNLKAINLPSGGRYEIDYESDTYAYVQNEVAMQMFSIVSMEPYRDDNNELIEPTTAIQHPKNAPPKDRKVFFRLEKPLSTSLTNQDLDKEMQKYIRPGEYLYFRVKINMTNDNGTTEYVAGYAKVDEVKVDPTSEVSGEYIWGYVLLDHLKVDGQDTDFHPFTEAGARHIRYNDPELLYDNNPNANMDDLSVSQIKNVGWSLISVAQDLTDIFSDYTEMLYKDGNNRLSDIELDKSYLRMRTPDKVKFGGGHRVSEVRIIDNWAASFLSGGEASSTYGTVYEYDMEDENGNTISSGVAAYEPLVGGDEIALRNPVAGWEDKNILSKTMAHTYTEEPGNESLFPGPTVGYRQVKVMSKNTAEKKNNLSSPIAHYGGISVHEFYTARDYPIITDNTELQTDKTFRKSRLLIPAVIVNIDRLRVAASQGYYIELNDMHGKPKGGREIAFNALGEEEEISSVKYEYFDEAHLTTNRAGETFITRSLKNDVDVLYSDIDPLDGTRSDIRTSTLATEIEFVPETRYAQSRNISAGLDLNFESWGWPLFFPIPSFNWQEEKTGTVVTNKIVNKAGIVKKVTAAQRGSVAETENLAFDDITGLPLLTSVTNDYGNKVYNYSIMARGEYEQAGAAYENIGFSIYADYISGAVDGKQVLAVNVANSTIADGAQLVPGDMLLAQPVLSNLSNDGSRAKRICYFSDQVTSNGNLIIEIPTANSLVSGLYRFTVIRSGRRNNLSTAISSITALDNPTINRTVNDCRDNANVKFTQFYKNYTIDNVLAITAVEMGHHWYKDTRQIAGTPGTWYDNAMFSKGFGGTLSPVRSYAYVDDRTQRVTSGQTNVDLEHDGVMNDVSLFSWNRIQSRFAGDGCVNKWKEVDQVTLTNPSSFGIESRNILQTYSSSIYGRSGTEPIAVAANARNTEIGFENFEEYTAGTIDITQNSTNNLNFYTTIATPLTPRYAEDRFDVINGADYKGRIYVPNGTFTKYSSSPTVAIRIHFDAYTDGSSAYYPAEEVLARIPDSCVEWSSGLSCYQVTLPPVSAASPIQVPKYDDRKWRGELFARKTLPNYPSTANSGVSIVDGIGHTGDKCLALDGVNSAKFMQSRLTLTEGKEYQFSGWFSTPGNAFLLKNYDNFFINSFQVEFFDANGTLLSGQTKTFTEQEVLQGTFIDDWQKFTLNFTVPAGAVYASVTLPATQEVFMPGEEDDEGDYEQIAYFDDLRIQPRDAGMETYVYNQGNYRLEAQLDANNYATFYYYDDEGALFLVKRETEKGIITVQESRNYLRKH